MISLLPLWYCALPALLQGLLSVLLGLLLWRALDQLRQQEQWQWLRFKPERMLDLIRADETTLACRCLQSRWLFGRWLVLALEPAHVANAAAGPRPPARMWLDLTVMAPQQAHALRVWVQLSHALYD